MSIFGDYARYYNLLYQDKEYAAETEFILECLTRYGGMPATLLDLGCGTGRHALEMARRGVCVTGVDMSATMLEMGRQLPLQICLRRSCRRYCRKAMHVPCVWVNALMR